MDLDKLGTYDLCPTCKEFGWSGRHTCPPEWTVHIPGWHGDDEWSKVRARDAEEAGAKAVEQYDSVDSDCRIAGKNETVKVIVTSQNGARFSVRVAGELRAHYYGMATAILDVEPTNSDGGE